MDKPFIKLFQTPNNGYFLDVNKDEIIPISDNSFQYLGAVLDNVHSDELIMPDELVELINQGYLTSASSVEEVRHAYSNFLNLFLDRKVRKITLQVTQECNFRCRYCIYTEKDSSLQRTHSSRRMSLDTAKEAVDFLCAHSIDSPSINIGFYGGEPLLEFELIRYIVRYAEERFFGKDLSFTITTNGSLISVEIIRFFQEHNISLMISLDGPKEINDKNRIFANGRGTFDTVMEKIELVKKVAPGYAENLMISMVIDTENDFDCINNICLEGAELESLNFQISFIDHDFDNKRNTPSEDYMVDYQYQNFLAILSYFNRFPNKCVSPIAIKAVEKAITEFNQIGQGGQLMGIDAPSGPCIPGQFRPFIDVTGRIFPCERVSETSTAMCIGSIKDGFDISKANCILNVGSLTDSECRQCWCFRYCMQCAKKADDGSRELSKEARLSNCDESKASARLNILRFLLFKEIPVYYKDQTRKENKEELFT